MFILFERQRYGDRAKTKIFYLLAYSPIPAMAGAALNGSHEPGTQSTPLMRKAVTQVSEPRHMASWEHINRKLDWKAGARTWTRHPDGKYEQPKWQLKYFIKYSCLLLIYLKVRETGAMADSKISHPLAHSPNTHNSQGRANRSCSQ